MAVNCQNGTKMLISRVVEQTVVEQRQDQLGLVQLREAFQLKNVPKSGKSPQGGGSAKNIKKSKIRNLDFLIRGGGRPYFHFFPKFKCSL